MRVAGIFLLAICVLACGSKKEDEKIQDPTVTPDGSTTGVNPDGGSVVIPDSSLANSEGGVIPADQGGAPNLDRIKLTCTAGQTAGCIEVNPGYQSGSATCNQDGTWNVDDCYVGQKVDTYGIVKPIGDKTFGFLLDSDKMSDNAYVQAHPAAVLMEAVFQGTVGNEPFPPAGAMHMSLGIHQAAQGTSSPAMVAIMQQSVQLPNPVNPLVQMGFLTDNLSPGIYIIQKDVSMVLLNIEDLQSQKVCLKAMAFGGAVVVKEAKNTNAKEGGSLKMFIPHDIKLYHPTETPIGDISDKLSGGGATVCPK